jgi:hypothetical protein
MLLFLRCDLYGEVKRGSLMGKRAQSAVKHDLLVCTLSGKSSSLLHGSNLKQGQAIKQIPVLDMDMDSF